MTDPPVPHDLPRYLPNDPPKWRVQLYRGQWGWNWTHQCDATHHKDGHSYMTWRMAYRYAYEHAKECL
ncbi:hypothetical protein [Streptomyces sp. NPDC058664]|uniref:hypothetical protein n=1 Tax=unclassified Streptomyces TaxID=2593676 RepID=UPI00364C7F2B